MKVGGALTLGKGIYQAGTYMDPADSNKYKIAVLRSTNNGASWVRSVLLNCTQGYSTAIVFRTDNPNTGYVAGYYYDASWYMCGKVFRTTDAGVSWSEFGPPVFATARVAVNALAPDPGNSNTLLAGTTTGVFFTTNGGVSWSSPAQSINVQSLAADPAVPGRYWLGSYADGVWESPNWGLQWQKINNGLPAKEILSLAYDAVNRRLYAGTKGFGTYRLDVTTGVGDENQPATFALSQNFPNPFNPTTVIRGQWSVTSDVKLAVYDVLGREVARLANGQYPAGSHEFTFDARLPGGQAAGLASGVYIYRLTAGDFTATRRMVLIR